MKCGVFLKIDPKYMNLALNLAKKGRGYVKTNPLVGAVIVKNGQILSTGYHKFFGGYHAERNAILNLKGSAYGATLYVNLEPCSHYGKTPPCANLIINSKIKRVVVGTLDPNPLVFGEGIKLLKKSGIEVYVGCMQKKCEKLNEIFFHNMKTKMPFVALKFGMTADGKISTYTGNSKWITGELSRRHSHYLRSVYGAVLVGINTVISDNPQLNCRLPQKRDPVRIICDTHLKTPLNSKIVKTAKIQKTYIACSVENSQKIAKLQRAGVEILKVRRVGGRVDLKELLKKLYQIGIDSVLVEGGSEINHSFVENNLINVIYSYIAPKIIGGVMAKTPVGGQGFEKLSQATALKRRKIRALGDDVLIEYRSSHFGK